MVNMFGRIFRGSCYGLLADIEKKNLLYFVVFEEHSCKTCKVHNHMLLITLFSKLVNRGVNYTNSLFFTTSCFCEVELDVFLN